MPGKGKAAALAALAAIVFSFAGAKPHEEPAFEYAVIEEGQDAALSERGPSLFFFTDAESFDRFYGRIHENRVPAPAPPRVDFGEKRAVFISQGMKNTGGYAIDVLGVGVLRDELFVKARLRKPSPDSFQVQAITHPYAILSVTRGNYKKVSLVDEGGARLASVSLP